MKKLILSILLIFPALFIQSQSRWNAGITTGCVTNISKFNSGDETANALFENYPFHSFGLGINVKYKISEKLSFQTGLNFNQIGFTYGIMEDYSLLKPWEGGEELLGTTGMASIPAVVQLRTPLNCSNVRFVFGLGASVRGITNNWNQDEIEEVPANEAANTNASFITAKSKTVANISPAITWQIGIEKVLRKGNSLSFMFTGNQGLTTIAESTVHYTATNKNYTHTFINRGSYVNLALAYNFMSFGSKKALKTAK